MSARRLSRAAALALASASLSAGIGAVALAGPAAAVSNTVALTPGQSTCVQQYASFQVRATGTATADGARFKLLKDGAVIDATPGRVTAWADERRTSYGTFPGPGYYAACAYNTGTRTTTVYLNVLTDSQFA